MSNIAYGSGGKQSLEEFQPYVTENLVDPAVVTGPSLSFFDQLRELGGGLLSASYASPIVLILGAFLAMSVFRSIKWAAILGIVGFALIYFTF